MNCEFVIVGGGISGAAAALELAGHGRVAIVERGGFGRESSWAGAGLLSALLPWDYPLAVSRLVERGRALFPQWVAALQAESGIDPEYRASGMLVMPPFDAGAAQAWASASDQACQRVSAPVQVPQVGKAVEALWLPGVAQVRNPRLMQAMRATLARRGVTLIEQCAASRFQVQAGRVQSLETTHGPLSAETYIVAAGAWAGELLGQALGATLAIKPMRGQIVLLKGAPGVLRHIVYEAGLYVIPRDDGHILIGSTLEDVGFDKSTTLAARDDLLARARALLPPLADLPLLGQWAGLRPGSPDNVPTIGRHPEITNLYMNAGHFRYGVTMAPASAELLADRIFGRASAIPADPYCWT